MSRRFDSNRKIMGRRQQRISRRGAVVSSGGMAACWRFFFAAFLCSVVLFWYTQQYWFVQTLETTLIEVATARTPATEEKKSETEETTQLTEKEWRQQRPPRDGDGGGHHPLPRLVMETKEIAPGVDMPVLSIGTGGLERNKAYEIVSNWLSIGGTGIDTAFNYKNQREIADAIDDYNNTVAGGTLKREDIFVTTKIPNCKVNEVIKHIDEDLQKLRTSYVDLMLIHAPSRRNCIEAWKILEDYYYKNKTRAIGVSNFKQPNLKPLIEQGTVIPHVNQIKLNIAHKDMMDTIRYATQHGIVIEGYSPLGRGGGEVVDLPIVKSIAKSHNVTAYQVAVKWILQHGWILTFQSSSKKHQASNADVFGWNLTSEEMDLLDQVGQVN